MTDKENKEQITISLRHSCNAMTRSGERLGFVELHVRIDGARYILRLNSEAYLAFSASVPLDSRDKDDGMELVHSPHIREAARKIIEETRG